jgi:hypothetical protein
MTACRWSVWVVGSLLLAACSSDASTPVVQTLPETCPAQASDGLYFPLGTFDRRDTSLRWWYSIALRAMNEPSMSCGQARVRSIDSRG